MNSIGKVINGKYQEYANTSKGGNSNGALAERVATAESDIDTLEEKANASEQALAGKVDSDGDISNTVVTFGQAAALANVNSGDSMSVALGKLSKLYAELDGKAAYYPVTTEFPVSEVGKLMDAKTVSDRFERHMISIGKTISTANWYRILSYSIGVGYGDVGIIMIGRGYQNAKDEGFVLSYVMDYEEVSWNCINALRSISLFDKIRFTVSNDQVNLEIHYIQNAENPVFVKVIPLDGRSYSNKKLEIVSGTPTVFSEYTIPTVSDFYTIDHRKVLLIGQIPNKINYASDNLNNYVTPGVYVSDNLNYNIENLPPGANKAGKLIVSDILGTSNNPAQSSYRYLKQTWENYEMSGDEYYSYVRIGHTGSGSTVQWRAWKTIKAT